MILRGAQPGALETEPRVVVLRGEAKGPRVFGDCAIVILALFGVASAVKCRCRRAAAQDEAAQNDRGEPWGGAPTIAANCGIRR
jgi:hypothetical protein